MRRARLRSGVQRIALVGYTNAGKSTLFNALSGADAWEADQLFATLDPTVRKLEGLSCGEVVISDTVGFVRDLPHDLVAAFRSTLAEARDADLLLHVVDAADPLREDRIGQVDAVLDEIGAGDIPQLLVFNKIDQLDEAEARLDLDASGMAARVWLSARTGMGMDWLRQALEQRLAQVRVTGQARLSPLAGRLRARLFEAGAIRAEQHDEDGWQVELDMPVAVARRILGGDDPDSVALRGQLLAAG
jgi:GTP-binding protein HflX